MPIGVGGLPLDGAVRFSKPVVAAAAGAFVSFLGLSGVLVNGAVNEGAPAGATSGFVGVMAAAMGWINGQPPDLAPEDAVTPAGRRLKPARERRRPMAEE